MLLYGVWHRCRPRVGYEGSAVQLRCARSASKGAHRDRDGLAAPVVQVAVVRGRAEAGADYAAASSGLPTPVSNCPPETHMRCMITASLRATATRARLAPRRRAMATPHVTGFSGGPREELVILLERCPTAGEGG